MKLKRREMLVAALAAGGMKAGAQELETSPGELTELARRTMKSNRDAIDKVKLPMAVEPAFAFKA